MYSVSKTITSLPIITDYIMYIRTLIKQKTSEKLFITKAKLFFYWVQTNTFLVATPDSF